MNPFSFVISAVGAGACVIADAITGGTPVDEHAEAWRPVGEAYAAEALCNAAYDAAKNGEDIRGWNLEAWGINPDSVMASANSAAAIVDRQALHDEQQREAA